jgi:hypothetical protein
MMTWLLLLASLGLLVGGIWTSWWNWRSRSERPSSPIDIAFWPAIAVGIFLGAAFAFVTYSFGPDLKIVGFPIPAAAWERWDNKWVDFVGAITPIAMFFDFLIGLTFPQIVTAIIRKVVFRAKENST